MIQKFMYLDIYVQNIMVLSGTLCMQHIDLNIKCKGLYVQVHLKKIISGKS